MHLATNHEVRVYKLQEQRGIPLVQRVGEVRVPNVWFQYAHPHAHSRVTVLPEPVSEVLPGYDPRHLVIDYACLGHHFTSITPYLLSVFFAFTSGVSTFFVRIASVVCNGI